MSSGSVVDMNLSTDSLAYQYCLCFVFVETETQHINFQALTEEITEASFRILQLYYLHLCLTDVQPVKLIHQLFITSTKEGYVLARVCLLADNSQKLLTNLNQIFRKVAVCVTGKNRLRFCW